MNKVLSAAVALLLAAAPAYAATTTAKPAAAKPAAAAPAAKHAMKHAKHAAKKDAGSATKALNALQSGGYTGLSNFGPKGKGYGATVTKDGKTFNVTVDPTGKIVQG